jgi:hypothetical protein
MREDRSGIAPQMMCRGVALLNTYFTTAAVTAMTGLNLT